MTEPLWLDRDLMLALYEDVVAASGGAAGLRDERLLESALARPVNRFHDEACRDLVDLAATYAVAAGEADLPSLSTWLRSVTETA